MLADVNVDPDSNYTVIPISSKYKLIYSWNSFLTPIVSFKLAEELPCIDSREEGYTPGRWFYPLFKMDHENRGCKSSFSEALKFDPWFVFIDKVSEDDYFK